MLVEFQAKRKCVIFHGIAESGKSKLAEFMKNIFDAHWKHAPRGNFDERTTQEDTHKQLLIINEANMFELFAKRNIPYMKLLMEGQGCPVENK